jgi:hypothetical protein
MHFVTGSSEPSSPSSSSSTPTDLLSQFNAQQLLAKQDLDVRLAKIAFGTGPVRARWCIA